MHLVCDLGTANVRAAVIGGEQIFNEPCVVAYDKYGRTIVGNEAYQMLGRNPSIIDIVKPVEGGAVKNLPAVIEVIRHCAKELGTTRFARKFTLTLSMPTGLTQVELRALEDAGKSAGASQVQFMTATVAAAVAAELPIDMPKGCLVVNLGAGNTEASLLSLKGVVASHRVRTGGSTMDEAILDKIKKEHAFLLGQRSMEELKHYICGEPTVPGMEVRGRNLRTGLPDTLYIPRSTVEEEVDAYCDTIVDLVGQTISASPPELAGDVVEQGVVLVGGGARMENLTRKLRAKLDIPVVIPENAETCVVRGILNSSWIQRSSSRPAFLRKWMSALQAPKEES